MEKWGVIRILQRIHSKLDENRTTYNCDIFYIWTTQEDCWYGSSVTWNKHEKLCRYIGYYLWIELFNVIYIQFESISKSWLIRNWKPDLFRTDTKKSMSWHHNTLLPMSYYKWQLWKLWMWRAKCPDLNTSYWLILYLDEITLMIQPYWNLYLTF